MSQPTATVGMIGAGQLARMTHAAAIGLGVDLRVLAAAADDAAAQVAPHVVADWNSPEDLRAFADGCDVVTFDHELVDSQLLAALATEGLPFAPPPAAKRFAQDKLHQRRRLREAGLPVPAFTDVADAEDVRSFGATHGWPLVLKAARGGYDGRGVWLVPGEEPLERIWADAAPAQPLLAESHVDIGVEVAVLVARTADGVTVAYPPTETVQREGICVETLVPSVLPTSVADQAAKLSQEVADTVGVVGLCAVELFCTGEGDLVINELALRPHNSGHWTIEGAVTSQFANHLRAVLGWPLGDTAAVAPAVATVNLLGPPDGTDPAARLPAGLAIPDAHVHLYGKAARPGRKLGHVTVVGDDVEGVRRRARDAARRLLGREG